MQTFSWRGILLKYIPRRMLFPFTIRLYAVLDFVIGQISFKFKKAHLFTAFFYACAYFCPRLEDYWGSKFYIWAMLILLDNMVLSLSFPRSFRVVIQIVPKVCEESRGFGKLFVEIIISQIPCFVNEAFATRIWSRSLAASVKRRRCRHEAKRTLTSPWAEGSLHRTKTCFIFMHHRCASLQPKTKKQSNGLLSFLCCTI